MNAPGGGWPPQDPYGQPPGGYGGPPPGYGAPPPPGYGPGYYPQPASGHSNNAVIALVLAIAGWVLCGCFTSIPAIFVARSELDAIERGASPPGGKGLAQAAFWIAVINAAVYVVIILLYVVIGVIAATSRP
jgi:hypothetical protein